MRHFVYMYREIRAIPKNKMNLFIHCGRNLHIWLNTSSIENSIRPIKLYIVLFLKCKEKNHTHECSMDTIVRLHKEYSHNKSNQKQKNTNI